MIFVTETLDGLRKGVFVEDKELKVSAHNHI